ncbi:MAG: carcinine hydrolase/isopenicillin-N N-acyltransferase family protein [Candidatus Thorarchaeota archaeon]
MKSPKAITLAILAALLILPLSSQYPSTLKPSSDDGLSWINEAIQTLSYSEDEIADTMFWEEECSSVIVTGNASKDGRAILMKNRDWSLDPLNCPFYVPATSGHFAYVGVNTNTMGINERGLAVMNTAMPELEPEPGLGNLDLNQRILEEYESVDEVATALNDSRSLIGPTYRGLFGTVATCVGIVDRFGAGAFFEISNTEAYVQYIVDGYDSRANHARIFPGHASGPSGRDHYLLNTLDEVYAKNGVISWEDIMQNASRYVRNKELGSSSFSIDGEVCNTATVAAMVAVSGDARYDGQLNIMWSAYGLTPLVGVFVPSMVVAGETPDSVASLCSYTSQKYASAQVQNIPVLLDPSRVREIQTYAFFAEEYTMNEYDRLMSSVPTGLSDYQIQTTLREFIARNDDYAAQVFIEESFSIEVPASVSFPTPTTSSTTITTTTTDTSTSSTVTTTLTDSSSGTTSTTPTETTTSSVDIEIDSRLIVGFSIGGAMSIIMILIFLKRYQ